MPGGQIVPRNPENRSSDGLVFRRGDRPLLAGSDPDEQVDAATEELYWEGIPENTRAIYAYQWKRFVNWCGDESNGPPHPRESMPATPQTVAKYVEAHQWMRNAAGKLAGLHGQPYAPDTVRLALAVISVAHKSHGLLSPTSDRLVITTMRGYARRWKKAGHRTAEAYAPSPAEVMSMVRTFDLETVAGLRDALLMRLHLAMGRRNSELMALDWRDLRFQGHDRLVVHIPFSKTNVDGERDDYAMVEADTVWHPETCPLVLLREWRDLCSARGIAGGAVLRKVHGGAKRLDGTRSGVILEDRMDRRNYQDVVTKAAKLSSVDRDPVTGQPRKIVPHSLRAAFATFAAEIGIPLGVVCDQGGWSRSSPVVLKYQRQGNRWGDNNPASAMARAAHEREVR
jgi:integrase